MLQLPKHNPDFTSTVGIYFFFNLKIIFQNCYNLFSLHCNPTFVSVHLITSLTQCGQTDMSNHLFRISLLFLSPQNDTDLS